MPHTPTAGPKRPVGHTGERRKRNEDVPLLIGKGTYTSDLRFENMVALACE